MEIYGDGRKKGEGEGTIVISHEHCLCKCHSLTRVIILLFFVAHLFVLLQLADEATTQKWAEEAIAAVGAKGPSDMGKVKKQRYFTKHPVDNVDVARLCRNIHFSVRTA